MMPIFRKPRWASGQVFDDFRNHNVEMINKYIDVVLCVSGRVAEIAGHYGVNRDKLRISYIGTKVAETASYKNCTKIDSPIFTLLFMGYAAKEKGFFFLLDILEQMPDNESRGIALKFASKMEDIIIRRRVEALRKKYQSVTIYDGYNHSDFPEIMENVNLGIVPPQWEDNLPQVTIEMIANGIPALTSDRGGTHELNSHPMFTFSTKTDCQNKIIKLKNSRNLLSEYWGYSKKITTMEEHIASLLEIYSSTS